jgi:hypothetical protein
MLMTITEDNGSSVSSYQTSNLCQQQNIHRNSRFASDKWGLRHDFRTRHCRLRRVGLTS